MAKKNIFLYLHLFRSFLVIGSVSFGGYLSLIGFVRKKIVLEDRLIEDEKITEAIVLASLLPGPLAVNVVAYIGYTIGGVFGAIVSAVGVLLPSYILLLLLSIVYFEFNTVIDFNGILMGIMPVVVAIILQMVIGMWNKNCKRSTEIGIALVSLCVLIVLHTYWAIVIVIILSGIMGIVFFMPTGSPANGSKVYIRWSTYSRYILLIVVFLISYGIGYWLFADTRNFQLVHHFGTASLTLFGGGYVMIPVLNALLVEQLHWVTTNEFFLGISFGQITPGPILISAVFFGYKVNGVVGSLLASFGIFFPSSMIMILASKFYMEISSNRKINAALQGIKPAVVGLILYAAYTLILSTELYAHKAYMVVFVLLALLVLEKGKINPILAVIIGSILGYFYHFYSS